MIVTFLNASDLSTVKTISAIEVASISAQSLAGVSYFSVEGRNYGVVFDYFAERVFFDGLASSDGLFMDYLMRFKLYDTTHYAYIPKRGGLSKNLKTGIIKISGVDSVSRAIKKLQDTEIDIERFDKDVAVSLKPYPAYVTDDLFYDRIPYHLSSALDYVMEQAGVTHTRNYVGYGLPALSDSYDVIDAGLDDEYVFKTKFVNNLQTGESWLYDPEKPTEPYGTYKPRVFFIYQTTFGKCFAYQQYYRAISQVPQALGQIRYRFHQYIYRVTGILWHDKPFFRDYNVDGYDIYDGREQEEYAIPYSTDESYQIEEYSNYTSRDTFDIVEAEGWWNTPDNVLGRSLYAHEDWYMFRYYRTLSVITSINSRLVDNLPTDAPELPEDPELYQDGEYWFDDDKDTLKYLGKVNLDIYKTEKFSLDEEEQIQQRKEPQTMNAADMIKQMLFMSNLVIVSDKEKIDIVDKSVFVDSVTNRIDEPSGRDINGGTSPEILGKPTAGAWDAAIAGNLLGQTANNGTIDIITGGADWYLSFVKPGNANVEVQVYYTLDGTYPVPGTSSTHEFITGTTGRVELSGSQYIRAYAYKQGWQRSELLEVNFNEIISTVLPRPVITPPDGLYRDSLVVEIDCEDENATIYYTDDGSTPTSASNEYTAPLTFDDVGLVRNIMIKAIAVRAAFTDSAITKASYTILPTFTLNRSNIIEMSIDSQIFDIDKLAAFNDVAYADQIESYLRQFYETKIDSFYEVITLTIDNRVSVPVRSFVKLSGEIDVRYVASARTDVRTGLQELQLWECAI